MILWVRNSGIAFLAHSLASHGIDWVYLVVLLVLGLVWRVQDRFTHMPDALARRTRGPRSARFLPLSMYHRAAPHGLSNGVFILLTLQPGMLRTFYGKWKLHVLLKARRRAGKASLLPYSWSELLHSKDLRGGEIDPSYQWDECQRIGAMYSITLIPFYILVSYFNSPFLL